MVSDESPETGVLSDLASSFTILLPFFFIRLISGHTSLAISSFFKLSLEARITPFSADFIFVTYEFPSLPTLILTLAYSLPVAGSGIDGCDLCVPGSALPADQSADQ